MQMSNAIKKTVRGTFLGTYLLSELHIVESKILPKLITDESAIRLYYKKQSGGQELDLEAPKRFSEKTNWYKLHSRDPLMQVCADKYAVREYVAKCGLERILNSLYGVYYHSKDISLKELPSRFVLKASHGSHMNIVYPDTKYSWRQSCLLLDSWLRQDIYWSGREWVYKDMPKRIIAEKFLSDETGELRDFKLFCFDGEPVFLQFDMGRFKGERYRNYYDMDLRLLDVSDCIIQSNPDIKPIEDYSFEEMKSIARVLSKPFQFVRTDFYLIGHQIVFGEMTFFPASGLKEFEPKEWDLKLGEYIKLYD